MHRRLTKSILAQLVLASAIAIITPTACLAQTAPKDLDFAYKILSGGINRTIRVHVPPRYNRSVPIPIVFVFHGLHMNAKMMSLYTRFEPEADRKNFVVVYPDGLGGKWDTSGGSDHDDVKFVSDMISQLQQLIKIDIRRMYVAGMSNGGYFVERLACELPDRFAGMAVVGSSMMQAEAGHCQANRRIPTIFFIGTDDPLVPSDDDSHNATLGKLGDAVGLGGLGSLSSGMARMGGMMTGAEAVDFWCRHNGTSTSPYVTAMPHKDPRDGMKVTRDAYGSYNGEVVCYWIQGGGHTWPGAVYNGPADMLGKCTQDIDATELIADFFLRHSN